MAVQQDAFEQDEFWVEEDEGLGNLQIVVFILAGLFVAFMVAMVWPDFLNPGDTQGGVPPEQVQQIVMTATPNPQNQVVQQPVQPTQPPVQAAPTQVQQQVVPVPSVSVQQVVPGGEVVVPVAPQPPAAGNVVVPVQQPAPTQVPVQEVAPTQVIVPPTIVPPTIVPPTIAPPTIVPPTIAPPTIVPPTIVTTTPVPLPPTQTPIIFTQEGIAQHEEHCQNTGTCSTVYNEPTPTAVTIETGFFSADQLDNRMGEQSAETPQYLAAPTQVPTEGEQPQGAFKPFAGDGPLAPTTDNN